MVRAFHTLTWKCASRHSGVPFSTSELQNGLRNCQSFNILTWTCNFSISELQKVVQSSRVLYMFTWKCDFRYSSVQFFDIGTSKSAPNPSHFDLKIRFSPQPRAVFRHRNSKNCSETLNFLVQNALLATAACNFRHRSLKKCSETLNFFVLTSKCASCHSGVQFLISPLTTWPRTRRCVEPTFRITRHTFHGKNAAFRDFSNCIFGLLTLLRLFAFHLLFNSWYCRKFTI